MTFVAGDSTAQRKPKRPGRRNRPAERAFKRNEKALAMKTVELGLGGNVVALKLCIERLLPAMKPVDMPKVMRLPGGSEDRVEAIFQQVAEGKLTVPEAAAMVGALETGHGVGEMAKILREVKDRLVTLEQDRWADQKSQKSHAA